MKKILVQVSSHFRMITRSESVKNLDVHHQFISSYPPNFVLFDQWIKTKTIRKSSRFRFSRNELSNFISSTSSGCWNGSPLQKFRLFPIRVVKMVLDWHLVLLLKKWPWTKASWRSSANMRRTSSSIIIESQSDDVDQRTRCWIFSFEKNWNIHRTLSSHVRKPKKRFDRSDNCFSKRRDLLLLDLIVVWGAEENNLWWIDLDHCSNTSQRPVAKASSRRRHMKRIQLSERNDSEIQI